MHLSSIVSDSPSSKPPDSRRNRSGQEEVRSLELLSSRLDTLEVFLESACVVRLRIFAQLARIFRLSRIFSRFSLLASRPTKSSDSSDSNNNSIISYLNSIKQQQQQHNNSNNTTSTRAKQPNSTLEFIPKFIIVEQKSRIESSRVESCFSARQSARLPDKSERPQQ